MTFEFQSTHPQGVRLISAGEGAWGRGVSIHAPAGGATLGYCAVLENNGMFQSTHPQGVRLHVFYKIDIIPSSFNPRTRRGCDQYNPNQSE